MIRTYANTKAELNIAEERLNILMSRKEELYVKFFPLSAKISDAPAHTNKLTDAMAGYVAELTKVNPVTKMSLDSEITEARNNRDKLEYYLKRMEINLKSTTGIENELFYKIVVEGYRPTKAVNNIAEKYNKEPETIWKYYYPKIKKEILKCIVNV